MSTAERTSTEVIDDRKRLRPFARHYQPLVITLAALSGGMAVDRYWGGHFALLWCLSLFGWVGWWFEQRRETMLRSSALLLLSVAALGGAWHHARWSQFNADEIGLFTADRPIPACIQGIAQSMPRRIAAEQHDPLNALPHGDRTRLIVAVERIRDRDTWRTASGFMNVRVEGHVLDVQLGDRVQLFGQLSAPQPPLNPGEFDFAAYQRADRVLAELWVDHSAAIRKIDTRRGYALAAWLSRVRQHAESWLRRDVSGSQRGMAIALLLGEREQVDRAVNDAYFRTGMIHLLSISGLHVGILALGLMAGLRLGWLSRRNALVLVAVVTTFYALLIDAEPPALRATMLVVLGCIGMLLGRTSQAFNTLAAAAIVVLVLNPADLLRAGPQLSFLAAAVLVWNAESTLLRHKDDPLADLIRETRPIYVRGALVAWDAICEMTIVSILIWAVALPLIMCRFHIVAPISIALTPLLSVPIGVALFSGFGVLVLGGILPPLSQGCGWLCGASLELIEHCVQTAATLPGNHVWLAGPKPWWVVAFYLVLVLVCLRWHHVVKPSLELALVTCWSVASLMTPAHWPQHDRPLVCSFLAVGHGCAVLLELPNGTTLLYDCGRLGPPAYGAQTISSFALEQRVSRFDAVVISHADVDHYNALPELLRRFSVGNVFVSSALRRDASEPTRTMLTAVQQAGSACLDLARGDRIELDPGVSIEVLHPPPQGIYGSDNANSIVLAIEYAGRRLLLTGDLEPPGLERVLASPQWDCDVLLVPHHGSLRSNPPGCAAWCSPEFVVISGGNNPTIELVGAAYEQAGAKVLHTARDGTITCCFSSRGVELSTWRHGPLGKPTAAR